MNSLDKYAVIIEQICGKIEPGKKMLQKLMYLMERTGVELELNYSIHFFGPYSVKLDNAIHALESRDKIEIDTSGRTHIIRMGETTVDQTCEQDEMEKIQFVLSNFARKTALELEAITTLDYAAISILKGKPSDEEIVNQVKQIKGDKFTEEYLKTELELLKKYQFLQ